MDLREKLYTVEEAAQELGLSPLEVRRLASGLGVTPVATAVTHLRIFTGDQLARLRAELGRREKRRAAA